MFQIGQNKCLGLKDFTHTVPWTHVICDLNGKEIVGTFYVKKLHSVIEKEFKVAKVTKGKGYKFYSK